MRWLQVLSVPCVQRSEYLDNFLFQAAKSNWTKFRPLMTSILDEGSEPV